MKAPLLLFASAVLTCSASKLVLGQAEVTVPIKDESAEGSPLAVSGTVTFSDMANNDRDTWSHGERISVRNNSDTPIMAWKLIVSLVSPHGRREKELSEIDRFFATNVLAPGETVSFSTPLGESRHFARLRGEPPKVEPRAEVRVLYVQFEEGSEFGNKADGQAILTLRRNTWETLRGVDEVYRKEGPDSFMEALGKPVVTNSALQSVLQNILRTARRAGPSEAERIVQRMLTAVTEHEDELTEGS